MGKTFKTFGNLKDIPFDELGEKEILAMRLYPNYGIIRTKDSYYQGGRNGARIYEIRDTMDITLPVIRRKLDSILQLNAFSYIKNLKIALEKAQKNFPKYTFEIIGETDIQRPIYKITHFDSRMTPKITNSINNLSRLKNPKDPFRIEYNKYKLLDKARNLFKEYIINFHEDDKKLNSSKHIRCIVEYPNNKYGLQSRTKLLAPLARGEDPFYSELTILKSLDLARSINSNVKINITNKLRGSKRICEVVGLNISTGKEEIRYATLNILVKGINPFSKTMWDKNNLQEGYFYILECETQEGKIGLMYGISINPYNRLDSHLNFNKKINTKTKLIGLYKNTESVNKEAVLHLECQVKKNIGKNFFEKDECSTNTETVNKLQLNNLLQEVLKHKLIKEDNELLMEAIHKLFKQKRLEDL